jgi:hypothetical protein
MAKPRMITCESGFIISRNRRLAAGIRLSQGQVGARNAVLLARADDQSVFVGRTTMKIQLIPKRIAVAIALAFASLLSFAGRTAAEPAADVSHYYMLVFAVQSEPNVVRRSHTFAVFVRADGNGTNSSRTEVHCISWMPKSLSIQPLHMLPEPGVNLDLRATLDWAKSVRSRVSMWGPIAIRKDLFDKAVARQQQLESGVIEYLCVDRRYRGELASNCIHAVSDLDRDEPSLDTGANRGRAASEMVVSHFQSHFLKGSPPADWIVDRLDLRSRDIQLESGLSATSAGAGLRGTTGTEVAPIEQARLFNRRFSLRP